MVYNSILRMIEAVRNNDVEKFLKYIQAYLPDDEKEVGEKLIRESFSGYHVETRMDSSDEVQELKDRLDTLYMNYSSRISLWESMYYGLKKEHDRTFDLCQKMKQKLLL